MVALRNRLPTQMTVDAFLDWDADDVTGRRWQLVDGEPVMMAPASDVHGSIQSELIRLLSNHLVAVGSRCRVVTAPGIVPRVRAKINFRVPDIGVTCAPQSGTVMMPDPILLIEILSPSNEAVTRSNIWTYTTIPSVQEILSIRGDRIEAEVLRRDAAGNWPLEPLTIRPPGNLELPSLGFVCPISSPYRTAGLAE